MSSTSAFMSMKDVADFPLAGMLSPCLFPEDPVKKPPVRRSLATCAVVGGSPSLHGNGRGKEIDNHTIVFRAGSCKTSWVRQHAINIGSRTDYCVSFYNTAAEGNTKLVIPIKSWRWLSDSKNCIRTTKK